MVLLVAYIREQHRLSLNSYGRPRMRHHAMVLLDLAATRS